MVHIKCIYTKLDCAHDYCNKKADMGCEMLYDDPKLKREECPYYCPTKHPNSNYCQHLVSCYCAFEKCVKQYSLDENKLQIGKSVYYRRDSFGHFKEQIYIDSGIDYLEIDGKVLIGTKNSAKSDTCAIYNIIE